MSEKKCLCNRWAVSMKASFESSEFEKLYRRGIQCVTPAEYERIPQFRHREDALACLIGRLLLRHATKKFTGCEWSDILFERTEKGKPYLVSPEGCTFGLNVSHQGDYVGFASSCSEKVGVDLMRLDVQRNNKTADEYINSMAKSASPGELRMMRGQPNDIMKMAVFYRFWCLKESILKATGEGILNDLSRIDFVVNQADRYKQGCFLTSTTMNQDGQKQEQWSFEESFIDKDHSVAVCKEKALPRYCKFRQDPDTKILFSKVMFATLLEDATILNPLPSDGQEAYEDLMSKPRKTF